MNDAGIGRHDLKIVERVLTPAEEGVPLSIPRELELRVQLERVGAAEVVDLDGVIDHQLDGLQRVDPVRVAAETHDAVAHRGEIDHGRDAREVLQQHASGRKRDFLRGAALDVPPGQGFHIRGLHEAPILVPQQVLEQDLHRVRQPADFRIAADLKRRQTVDVDALIADLEHGPRSEAVHGRHVKEPRKSPIVPQHFLELFDDTPGTTFMQILQNAAVMAA